MADQHILVLGGARSGKSSFALDLAKTLLNGAGHTGRKGLFIATAQALDQEMEERISAHKRQRGVEWLTVEEPLLIYEAVKNADDSLPVILIDCLTMWLSNMLLTNRVDMHKEIEKLVNALIHRSSPVIMVSNEVGMGLVPESPLGRRFRDIQGQLNQRMASLCATVIFVAAGLPLALKGTIPHFNLSRNL